MEKLTVRQGYLSNNLWHYFSSGNNKLSKECRVKKKEKETRQPVATREQIKKKKKKKKGVLKVKVRRRRKKREQKAYLRYEIKDIS